MSAIVKSGDDAVNNTVYYYEYYNSYLDAVYCLVNIW